MSLSDLIRPITSNGGSNRYNVTPEWLQGRTCYGGASTAIALSAVKAAYPDLPPLRSVQVAFVGPLSGEIEVEPELLRRGKNSAFVSCALSGADGIGARILFLFMASRPSEISFLDLPTPEIFAPEDRLIDPAKLPQGFLTNFELSEWVRDGGIIRRWSRFKERAGLDHEVEFVAIADALPPAAMNFAKEWAPISTTTWQLNLVSDAPVSRDGWWLIEARTLQAGHGSSSQSMTIWSSDGESMATATQSVAVFI